MTSVASALALLGLAFAGTLTPACANRPAPAPAAATVREATGLVRGFNEARTQVRIAHDDIPGYMAAMTMTFDAKDKGQLDGLAEKDPVRFSFTEEGDGRYLLQSISRR